MSGLCFRVLARLRRACQALARPKPQPHHSGLAERIARLADDLAAAIDDAYQLRLAAPTPIANAVHDLRGWAARLHHPGNPRPPGANAAHIIAYIRGLPDQQLLALLADLPWPRLDALLDAIELADHASLQVGKHQ